MSFEDIALARQSMVDTIESYIAECITAGFAYDWQRMGISDAMRDRINFGLAHLLKQASLSQTQVNITAAVLMTTLHLFTSAFLNLS